MAVNTLKSNIQRDPYGNILPEGQPWRPGDNQSVNMGAENTGPHASIFSASPDQKNDYLRDIGQFSSRIPGLINDASGSGPRAPQTFGSGDPAYAAIANRSNQTFQQNVKDFGNKIKRDETQVQDQLLTNEIKRRSMNLDYQMQRKSLQDAQWSARAQKRAAIIGSIVSIIPLVGQGIGNSVKSSEGSSG